MTKFKVSDCTSREASLFMKTLLSPCASIISLDSQPTGCSLCKDRKGILEGWPGRPASESCVSRHTAGHSLCQWVSHPGNPGRGGQHRRTTSETLLCWRLSDWGSMMLCRLQRLTPGYIRLLQVRINIWVWRTRLKTTGETHSLALLITS